MFDLSTMKVGSKSEIIEIENSSIKSKLIEMGFLVGRSLEVVFKAPLGDPIAIEINSTVISLRKDEAAFIKVREKN
jgi:Fe2+ transport system protein FeoA